MGPFAALFSESASRALVTVRPDDLRAVADLCAIHGVPVATIGMTTSTGPTASLEVGGLFSVPLDELRAAWTAPLRAAFAGA